VIFQLKFIRNSGTESQGDMMQFSAPFVYEIGSDVTQVRTTYSLCSALVSSSHSVMIHSKANLVVARRQDLQQQTRLFLHAANQPDSPEHTAAAGKLSAAAHDGGVRFLSGNL